MSRARRPRRRTGGASRACAVAEDALYAHGLAEPLAALIVSLAGDYSGDRRGSPAPTPKNVLPRSSPSSTSCRSATSPKSSPPTRSSGQSMLATRSRRSSRTDPKLVVTSHALLRRRGRGRREPIEPVSAAGRSRPLLVQGRGIGQILDRPELTSPARSSSPAAGRCKRPRTSKTYIEPVADMLERGDGRLARRGRRRATCVPPTGKSLTGRQGRRARSLHSRSAYRGRSSILRGWLIPGVIVATIGDGRGSADLPGGRLWAVVAWISTLRSPSFGQELTKIGR